MVVAAHSFPQFQNVMTEPFDDDQRLFFCHTLWFVLPDFVLTYCHIQDHRRASISGCSSFICCRNGHVEDQNQFTLKCNPIHVRERGWSLATKRLILEI